MLSIQEFRQMSKGLPDLLNPAALIEEGVLLNKDGSLTVGIVYRGPDGQSVGDDDMDRLSAGMNHAFNQLGTGWTLHVHAIRNYSEGYIDQRDCFFPDPVSRAIDEERRRRFEKEGSHLETRYALTLTWRLPSASEQKLAKLVVSNPREAENDLQRHIRAFRDRIDNLMGILRGRFKVHLMSSDDLLTHYHECLTGLDHPVRTPTIPMYLDAVLGHHDAITGFVPQIAGQHIQVVSFMQFPQESHPDILERLTALPWPLTFATRFIFMDPHEAVGLLGKYRRNWFQKRHGVGALIAESMGSQGSAFMDQDAMNMTADADSAVAEASSGVVRFGYYSPVVILRHADEAALRLMVKGTLDTINNLGFVAQVESVNAMEALLGSLPGHTFENIRRPLIHTLNLADLLPKTAVWAGPRVHPNPFYRAIYQKVSKGTRPDAPVLAYGETSGFTPFRLCLHDSDVGHTLIFGPTGSGKSTILALLAAQHRRYPDAQIFAFDKGESLLALCKGVGGQHFSIGGEEDELAFAPLSRIHLGRMEQEWAAEWIESLCTAQEIVLTPDERRLIFDAVRRLAVQESRTITDFANTVASETVRNALTYYRIGQGRGAHLVDAAEDGLHLENHGTFAVFEMEHLLGGGGDRKIVIPVLQYLFHRIDGMLNGQPTLLILDEAWIFLDNPIFAAKIREWLKVLRKANCQVIFATQGVSDLRMDSPLRPVLMESCPTKILLPNKEALSANLRPIYADMGLSQRQIELVAMSTPKQDYYFMHPDGSRLIGLGLGPLTLAFTGVSGKEDRHRIRELIRESGDNWIYRWVRERGLSEELLHG